MVHWASSPAAAAPSSLSVSPLPGCRNQNVPGQSALLLTCRFCPVAAVGGAYEFARNAAANLREKNDHYNAGIGGFFAGSLIGIRGRSMP